MTPASALYSAYAARDPRFDGVFFIGVTSTGIYCRPVCTARTPRPANCRFFDSAALAEQAHFRPCLRCRPELAPGNASVDATTRLAQTATRLAAMDDTLQERLINWGYAICDIALRTWVDENAPAPGAFPFPSAGVG